MYDLEKILRGCLTILFFFFFSIIGSTLIGAFVGWIVGCFFGEIILNFFADIGIEGFTMWQLGASLGFIGSFFRTSNINYSKTK